MQRRLISEAEIPERFGIPLATYRELQRLGRMPGPIPELGLYDCKAIEVALDEFSGLTRGHCAEHKELNEWRERRRADVR
jgi:hypothetical protein